MPAKTNNLPIQPAKKVAYIIVSWNNVDIIDGCLKSIADQDYSDKKVIIVDNNSDDDIVRHVGKHHLEVELLAQKKNLGFAKGNNIGIDRAMEDPKISHIVLLNSDARLAPDWTSTLLAMASIKPKAAMLQSITLDYNDPGIIDSTHIYISRMGQAIQSAWRTPIAYGFEAAPQKVFGCNAAAMMITRQFIEAQPFKDFFDETMFMYLEDVDIAARATIMGWDNYLVPGTRAYHIGSVSSGKNPGFSLYMTFRNNLGLLIKNLPLSILIKVLFNLLRADRASIRHLRRVGQPENVPAIIKGRLASLLYIPIFLVKRRKLMRHRNIDSAYLWRIMRRGF